jgi:amino acid permease
MNKMNMTETKNKSETEDREPLKYRPLWQRLVYPIVGFILIFLGVILWLLPIVPGFFLIIIGLPMLFCFHPRVELYVRSNMKSFGRFLLNKIRSLKKSR